MDQVLWGWYITKDCFIRSSVACVVTETIWTVCKQGSIACWCIKCYCWLHWFIFYLFEPSPLYTVDNIDWFSCTPADHTDSLKFLAFSCKPPETSESFSRSEIILYYWLLNHAVEDNGIGSNLSWETFLTECWGHFRKRHACLCFVSFVFSLRAVKKDVRGGKISLKKACFLCFPCVIYCQKLKVKQLLASLFSVQCFCHPGCC